MVVIGLLIALVVSIIPIAIFVLIVSAIVKKGKDNNFNFESSIRNVYTYLILIVTLISIISGVISALKIGLDLALPEESAYESSYNNNEIDKNEDIIELLTTLSLVVAVTPVFIYHNKIAKQNKLDKIVETSN